MANMYNTDVMAFKLKSDFWSRFSLEILMFKNINHKPSFSLYTP